MNIPWNKGVTPVKDKKYSLFKAGIPIFCKKHGEHLNWRLNGDNNVQCRECSKESARNKRKLDPIGYLLRDAKGHARTKKIKFDITRKDIEDLIEYQDNKCAISGIEFSDKNKFSLDKIDPNGDYVTDNIQLVTIMTNRMKSDFDMNYFILMCKIISENNK